MKVERLWDAKRYGPIPLKGENTLKAHRLTRKRFERILRQYEERQAEIQAEIAGTELHDR